MINRLFRPLLEALPENNRLERIWVLAKTDFLKRYYGSFLGVVWALLNPLIQLGIYYSVFVLVFKSKQENFALFLFLGLILEMFFAETATTGLNVIRSKRYVLENIKINWFDIYYAATFSTFFAFLFNFFVLLAINLFANTTFNNEAWYVLPLLILNLLTLGFAVQLTLSTIQVYLKDVVHLWDMIKTLILWMSGIFYPIDPTPGSDTVILAYLTPIAGIIHNARQTLLYGQTADWSLIAYDWIYTIIVLFIAVLVFSKFVRKALEKV
jgi:ABC-type polysaccharide/polyol phosphate export permease